MAESIEKKTQYPDDPQGWAKRWAVEFEAAHKEVEPWHEQGDKVEKRYLDERDASKRGESRLNLFHGDIETRKALLYGNPPRVQSRRRFADANDDVARVSAEMQERLLNCDIERDEDGYATALGLARDDRLLPGLGAIRMRYVVEMEPVAEVAAQKDPTTGTELAPAVPATERKTFEDVETDYVHWRDIRWSPARFWGEVRWVAFKAAMTRDALHERFDASLKPELVDTIPLNSKRAGKEVNQTDPWSRSDVWEVWSKEKKEVFWYVEGFNQILDRKPDPLGLTAFWPCPRPLFANMTSSKLLPVPDFVLAQDVYNEIDDLSTKINLLEDALKVAGLYDKNQPEIARLVKAKGNTMVPVENWAMIAEKGGMKGVVDWFPLDQIVNALDKLGQKRTEKIALLYQVTGMSDIMRGQATGSATATEQRIKARAASTRTQLAQTEFARFATDAQKIRAEIIARHFDPQTIIDRSNVMRTADAELAQQAAQLLKDEHAQYRIEVAADGLAMTDFDAVKQESTEFLSSVGAFMKQIGEIGMMSPQAVPYLLEMLKVGMAGFRRAATMEGILDKAIQSATQAAQAPKPPPPPDPAMQVAQIKAQAEMGKAKASMQQTAMDSQASQAEHSMRMQELGAKAQADRLKVQGQLAVAASKPAPEAEA